MSTYADVFKTTLLELNKVFGVHPEHMLVRHRRDWLERNLEDARRTARQAVLDELEVQAHYKTVNLVNQAALGTTKVMLPNDPPLVDVDSIPWLTLDKEPQRSCFDHAWEQNCTKLGWDCTKCGVFIGADDFQRLGATSSRTA